jgi:hypothetical protein
MAEPRLGIGVGWRPEIDLTVERLPGVEFVEVLAENVRPESLPESLTVLRARGIPAVDASPSAANRREKFCCSASDGEC